MTQPVRAKKHLGQHFLKDQEIARDIVLALRAIYPDGPVLEVGPGMGVLTKFLLQNPGYKLWTSEIDTDSVSYLLAEYPQISERLLQKSFLEINLNEQFPEGIAVIGNFPYNISSQILFHVLEHRKAVPALTGMFQREVAIRIGASPGNKDYGILSVILQAWYQIEFLFTVPEQVFQPPPKVKSGVIRMVRKPGEIPCEEHAFRKVVKVAFNQRRKKLRNALGIFGLSDAELGKFANARAEELSLEDFFELTAIVETRNGKTPG